MRNDEAKALQLFIEREGLDQEYVGQLIGKQQPDVSKYISGKLKVPLKLVKALHLKHKMSYEFFFHLKMPMKSGVVEKRNIMTDLTDIHATLGMLLAGQDKMRDDINKMAMDLYAEK